LGDDGKYCREFPETYVREERVPDRTPAGPDRNVLLV
jgi:hypothetical protein